MLWHLPKGEGHNRNSCPNIGNQAPASETVVEKQSANKGVSTNRERMQARVASKGLNMSATNTLSSESTPSTCISQPHKPSTPVSSFVCYVDITSGRTILDPGQRTEPVIDEGVLPSSYDPAVQARFPIPKESNIRRERTCRSTDITSRTIHFTGDGSHMLTPNDLPFQTPWTAMESSC